VRSGLHSASPSSRKSPVLCCDSRVNSSRSAHCGQWRNGSGSSFSTSSPCGHGQRICGTDQTRCVSWPERAPWTISPALAQQIASVAGENPANANRHLSILRRVGNLAGQWGGSDRLLTNPPRCRSKRRESIQPPISQTGTRFLLPCLGSRPSA